jgi:hypothetical protein
VDDDTYIDHSQVIGRYEYEGNRIKYEPVIGRPGWILADDIDIHTGHPLQVHEKDADKSQVKYWSPDLSNTEVKKTIAIRGYVTSVAMPSLDLGVPADTRQPKMMVRFCSSAKPKELTDKKEEYIGGLLSYAEFMQYIVSNRNLLEQAFQDDKMITFVTGHKNPDADTVISSALEAFHRYLSNSDADMVYLPLVQSHDMPKEISYILGDDLANAMIYSERVNITELLKTGKIRFIFTDQNYQKEYQKYQQSSQLYHLLALPFL